MTARGPGGGGHAGDLHRTTVVFTSFHWCLYVQTCQCQCSPPLPPWARPIRGAALTALVPLPDLKTRNGIGFGLAVCPDLGLLVTSDYDKNTLSAWGLPVPASRCSSRASCCGSESSGRLGASAGLGADSDTGGAVPVPVASAGGGGGASGGLRLVCTLGGAGSAAPMQFKFSCGSGTSGFLVFAPSTTTTGDGSVARPLLLVTDAGHDAVHLVDVVGQTHAGYLASPGSIAGPRGVAVSGTSPLVAVSAWKKRDTGDHVVVVYKGSGAVWEAVRVIGGDSELGGPRSGNGQLNVPYGLRFSRDGSVICVADVGNDRASVFRVGDGGFVRHIATGLSHPRDVEEVEGGWLVTCADSDTVEFVGDGDDGDGGGRPSLGKVGGGRGSGDGEFHGPAALATLPGLGLVVQDYGNRRLQVFATPEAIARARDLLADSA